MALFITVISENVPATLAAAVTDEEILGEMSQIETLQANYLESSIWLDQHELRSRHLDLDNEKLLIYWVGRILGWSGTLVSQYRTPCVRR